MEKKKLIVVGVTGRMGEIVCDLISKSKDFEASCGLNATSYKWHHEVSTYNYAEYLLYEKSNGVIDFSRPEATLEVLPYAVRFKLPMVIGTTKFTAEQAAIIEEASKEIPIFWSSNMAYSIKAFINLVKATAKMLPSYDIAIHERHHSEKIDAPSGTAKMLFDAVNEARGNTLTYRFDSTDGAKREGEVWVSSERVGKITGEHRVTFAGLNDIIELKHFVEDRAVFAEGALEAARFIMKQTEPRIYTMDDLFNE